MTHRVATGRWILAALVLPLATAAGAHEPQEERVPMRVESVVPGGPAATAGVQAGDHVVLLDGKEIPTVDDLRSVMAAHRPGDQVPLRVEREGKPVDLNVTLGELPDGGASLGVRLAVTVAVDPNAEPTATARECLAWIDKTYRIEAVMQDLGLDLSADWATARACVEQDMASIPPDKAIAWCDNVFKVHCAGIDLLGEIGDALVARCKGQLAQSLDGSVDSNAAWQNCAQHEIFDRYVKDGVPADEAACKAAWTRCSAASATER